MKRIYIVTALLLAFSALNAQENGQITVTNGAATVESVNYPVFTDVTSVDQGMYGGIRYTLPETNPKAALKKAEQVRKFYQNRKIAKTKFGTFRKMKSGDIPKTAWLATAKKSEKPFAVLVTVEETGVVVVVTPNGDERTLELIN